MAGLFVAALCWCLLHPPGNTYDVRPLPVPALGWAMWVCSLVFLASNAVLHFGWGRVLRQDTAPRPGAIVAWGLSNVLVAVIAGYSVRLQAASHAVAMGLENLTATLFTAAGLSVLMLGLTSFGGRTDAPRRNRVSMALTIALVLHWIAAMATAGGLFSIELLPLPK